MGGVNGAVVPGTEILIPKPAILLFNESMTSAATQALPGIDYILGDAAARYSREDCDLFTRVYEFARKAHETQRRASGEPYFIHCIETAKLLAELRMDPATLAAGLMHDVLEDTEVTREQLDQMFPAPMPELVEGVTKLSSLQFNSDREAQVESLRKMILAMARDVRVIIIKLCDRLHNMRTLTNLPESKQRQVAQSTLDIYAPLANRIGMSRIRSEIEDLSMHVLFPAAYAHMRSRVAKKRAERESIVNRSIEALRDHLAQFGLYPEITGRPKHFYSIYQKMQRQNLSFDQIYDLIALRVITDSVPNCYEIVGHLHALWHPVPGRFKDYIALPKDNGYQSIHTTVIGLGGEVAEVQIRTEEMHRMAEEGIAAHWRYKEGVLAGQEEKLAWLRRLVGWLQDVRDPNEFMNALKQDVFSEEVFCFTPKGDVIELPKGSTALDFAYYIHTDIGNQCAGARVNSRMVPLRTEIQMGDIVEIIRNRSGHPSPGWLDVAKTSRALSKIRHYLKSVDFEKNRRHGLDALTRALKTKGIDIPTTELSERLNKSLPTLKVGSFDELLAEIGFGSISAVSVAGRLMGEMGRGERKKPRVVAEKKDQIIIEDLPNVLSKTASCCTPLPGDPIIGFITRGRGVTVHRNDCANLQRILRNGNEAADRLVTARWGKGDQPLRPVVFRITCNDRSGLLRDVSQVFANLDLNIVEMYTKSYERNQRAILRIVALIQNAQQIQKVLNSVEDIPGVNGISRSFKSNSQ